MGENLIASIVTIVIGLLGTLFGGKLWVKARKVIKAVKEGGDVLGVVDKITNLTDMALKDQKLTAQETRDIALELKRLKPEWDEFVKALKDVAK